MPLLQTIQRFFFRLLYHSFAWIYDCVAATVSLGRWTNWIKAVIPHVNGMRVLELGHGPGHLLASLHDLGLFAIGLDESRQMGKLAANRLARCGYAQGVVARGLSQSLPFANASFSTIISTFPSEYILDPRTLTEVSRSLHPGGRFVVLPAAWITGHRPAERFMAWLFRITGQSANPVWLLDEKIKAQFLKAGFNITLERVEQKSSEVLIILATKES